jgi:hypothetical protein
VSRKYTLSRRVSSPSLQLSQLRRPSPAGDLAVSCLGLTVKSLHGEELNVELQRGSSLTKTLGNCSQ